MRSGSSLLVHLLNSNPEVLGYGETSLSYAGRRSFVKLHDHVRNQFEAHGEPPSGRYRYVMDKILWNHTTNGIWQRQVPLKVILIVRRPEAALPSILNLDLDEIQSPEEALGYYTRRLARIREVLEIYDSPFVLTTYTDLTERTNQALKRISEYLELEKKLVPKYETMWSTGKPGIGDPSEKIEEGKVQSAQSTYDICIGAKIIEEAYRRYDRFRSFCEDRIR